MLTKEVVADQITVLEDGQIEVRRTTRILEDGQQVASFFHRHVLAPADSVVGEDARVVAVARAVWTPDVVAAYSAKRSRQ